MVDDAKTFEQLSNASPFFRKLLQGKRVDFLAADVLKLIASREFLNGTGFHNKDVNHLAARKVCRSWCSGVDAFLEQRSYFRLKLPSNPDVHKQFKIHLMFNSNFGINCEALSARFMTHFEPTHSTSPTDRNPILGRAIKVSTKGLSPRSLSMINMYGEHIWFLNIYHNGNKLQAYQNLCQVLKAMPNLRQIELEICTNTELISDELRQEIVKNPPPLLPCLQAIKTNKVSSPLVTRILRDNPSVLYWEVGEAVTLTGLEKLHLQNLKHLKLTVYPDPRMARIKEIALRTPSLSMLTLQCNTWKPHCRHPHGSVETWQRIFQLVKGDLEKSELLSRVQLDLPKVVYLASATKMLREGVYLRLKLAKVETLMISMGNPCGLDFLLPMKKTLKWLRVKITRTSYATDPYEYKALSTSLRLGMERQHIQFLGWERRLLESNIWKEFPNLKEVILEGHLCYATKEGNWYESVPREELMCYTRKKWKLEQK